MLNPIAFEIFNLKIHWYGIFYTIGFLFGYLYITYYSKYYKINKNHIEEIFCYVMLFSIIGARIFEIIIYHPAYYFANPLKIFAVWQGGMSIHGGILGAVLSLIYSARKYKIPIYKLTDLFVIPLSLALAFGRLFNFINQELVGKPTTSAIGIIFPLYDNQIRWPSQLFESIKNILTFQILYFIQETKQTKNGTITSWFLILYGFGRFIVDFTREPTISLGLISMGQLLSLIFGIAGILLLLSIKKSNP